MEARWRRELTDKGARQRRVGQGCFDSCPCEVGGEGGREQVGEVGKSLVLVQAKMWDDGGRPGMTTIESDHFRVDEVFRM